MSVCKNNAQWAKQVQHPRIIVAAPKTLTSSTSRTRRHFSRLSSESSKPLGHTIVSTGYTVDKPSESKRIGGNLNLHYLEMRSSTLAVVTANGSGNWSATIPFELASGQWVRTTSTSAQFNTIPGMSSGRTTGLSEIYIGERTVFLPLVIR